MNRSGRPGVSTPRSHLAEEHQMRGSTMIRPRRTKFRPIVEGLDDRCLPSVAGLTPAQVATAYGLSGLTFGTRAANGSGQKIAIVEAYSASVPDLMAAVNVAQRISRVSVIAMSWGASEFSGETAYDSVFTTP